jgi:hypothetical protein
VEEKQRRKKAFSFVTFLCCFGQRKVNTKKDNSHSEKSLPTLPSHFNSIW